MHVHNFHHWCHSHLPHPPATPTCHSHLPLQKCISECTLLVLHLTNLAVIVVFPCVIILLGQPSPGQSLGN